MNDSTGSQILPGIVLSPDGQVTVDPSLHDVLFDLALALEDRTGLPVDFEHVLAAVILAARSGSIDRGTPLSADDSRLLESLIPQVESVFREHGGRVGRDD